MRPVPVLNSTEEQSAQVCLQALALLLASPPDLDCLACPGTASITILALPPAAPADMVPDMKQRA